MLVLLQGRAGQPGSLLGVITRGGGGGGGGGPGPGPGPEAAGPAEKDARITSASQTDPQLILITS